MNSSRDYEISAIKGSLAIAAGLIVFATSAWAQDARDHTSLEAIVRAEADEYIRLRNAMLDGRTQPWDVTNAAEQSWKHGIIAFALNRRLKIPDVYTHWDKHARQSRADITGRIYRFDRGGTTADTVAFLLEHSLKPQQGVDEQYPMGELLGRLQWAEGYPGIGPPAMWRSIWAECPFERLREASVFFLACSGDPEVLKILADVLRDNDSPTAKQFRVRCLTGLFYSGSEQAKALVIEEWDRLKSESLLGSAVAVLSTSADPRARDLMYSVALDSAESMLTRRDTIAKLSKVPHAGDRAFLRRFFSEVKSERLKREVLSYIAQWLPLDLYRDPVREILETSSDPKLVGPAINALIRGHKAPLPLRDAETGEWNDWGGFGSPGHREYRRKHPRPTPRIENLDLTAWQEDVTLLEQLGTRDDLPEDLRGHIERYLAGMHELRRRFDSQPPGD